MLPSCFPADSLPDRFNEYFNDKIENIRSGFNMDAETIEPASQCKTKLETFAPVTCDHVHKIVQSMSQKSCELDPLPASCLQSCLSEIVPTLTSIVNNSLSNGEVPAALKHAIVKPLLKKS